MSRLLATACLAGGIGACAQDKIVGFPENCTTFGFLRGEGQYFELSVAGWGPKWSYLGWRGPVTSEGDTTVATASSQIRQTGANVNLVTRVARVTPRIVAFQLNLTSDRDTDLTYICMGLNLGGKAFRSGEALVTLADGSTNTVTLPLGRKGLGEQVKQFVLVDATGDRSTFVFEPPLDIPTDNQARIVLADSLSTGAPVQARMTVEFPSDVTYYPGQDGIPDDPSFADWYTFSPSGDHARPSEIGMQDWLDKPAGRHGRIVRRADQLLYDGKPIKLWGLNICYSSCAPDKSLAEKRAAFYAKYGINTVRLHKYVDGPGWAGIQSKDSVAEFDPEGLDRLDYHIAKLKEAGIFVKLSQSFGTSKMGPADVRDVPYLSEFGSFSGKNNRVGGGSSTFYYSPEIQNLHLRQIINLLEHRNPYTGLTYAEDSGICAIEIINESSILFYTSMNPLKQSATIRKMTAERFCEWLRAKYETHDALVRAWGEKALDCWQHEGFQPVGEHLDKKNILPLGNPWFWDPVQLEGSQSFRKQRLLDTMEFLYLLQCEAYDRWTAAVRKAGYDGEIVASNWQAGRAYSHYYNLHTDARVGIVDRHNYFGGGSGAKISDASMLRVPGSGMLSAGMQQVGDRPFMLSEWIHVTPNEWGVEGPAIIGAYGMGLQGWDVSYMFQNRDNGEFSNQIGRDRWDVTAPNVLGVFPAVSRQVLRNDVRQSELCARRYVHVPSLGKAKLGFDDQIVQTHDVKAFDCDKVPARTLAVARCTVDFTDEYRDTPQFDLAKFADDNVYTSATDELQWMEGASKHDGYFTVNTPATKAVVGFANGKICRLGTMTIEFRNRFGAVYVTAQEPDADIASSRHLLVVAVARARNTGMKIFDDSRLIAKGKPPVVMEPVNARITLGKAGTPVAYRLDHDGCRTGETLPVKDGVVEIDGVRDKTPYYLISYGE